MSGVEPNEEIDEEESEEDDELEQALALSLRRRSTLQQDSTGNTDVHSCHATSFFFLCE